MAGEWQVLSVAQIKSTDDRIDLLYQHRVDPAVPRSRPCSRPAGSTATPALTRWQSVDSY
jgi:hypothetical protein